MWAWLTYLYNSILIIFIAAHLLVGAVISFAIGVYAGIYISQNYEIPRMDEPSVLWDKSVKFIGKYKKEKRDHEESNEAEQSEEFLKNLDPGKSNLKELEEQMTSLRSNNLPLRIPIKKIE